MIKIEEIEELGYELKTKLLNNTQDFRIDHDKFPRLINFSDGRIQVIAPISSKSKTQEKTFENIDDFIEYYTR